MRTLIYGAGPIGQWLALRLHTGGQNVTLLARNETFRSLRRNGIEIVDALTGQRLRAQVRLVDEFNALKNLTGKGTPHLDALLEHVMMPRSAVSKEEVA